MTPKIFKNASFWYRLWEKLPETARVQGRSVRQLTFESEGGLAELWFDSKYSYTGITTQNHRTVLEIHVCIRHPMFKDIGFYIYYAERRKRRLDKSDMPYFRTDRYCRHELPDIKQEDIDNVEHFLALLSMTANT